SGNRAGQANERLASAGVSPGSLTVLDGGIAAYESDGGEVVRSKGVWAMDRQVRMAAGSLVLTGVVGSQLSSARFADVADAVGAGLADSAARNSCAMAAALSRVPWNRSVPGPARGAVLDSLPTRS